MRKHSTSQQIYLPNQVAIDKQRQDGAAEELKKLNEAAFLAMEAQVKPLGQKQKTLHKLPEGSIISKEHKTAKPRQYKIDQRPSWTSLIEPEEAMDAIKAVETALGFEIPRTAGFLIDVRLHVDEMEDGTAIDEKGNKTSIALDEKTLERYRERERFRAVCGLVIGIGPDAFAQLEGPVCRVGDFVSVERQFVKESFYRGYAICTIPDDKVFRVISDPDHVTKDNVSNE